MGRLAHCLERCELRNVPRTAGGLACGREGPLAGKCKGRDRGEVVLDRFAANEPLDALSLLTLRQRSIRFWLAGIGFLAFGVAYISPIALAITRPIETSTAVVLPRLELQL